jgi:hypothetical protein
MDRCGFRGPFLVTFTFHRSRQLHGQWGPDPDAAVASTCASYSGNIIVAELRTNCLPTPAQTTFLSTALLVQSMECHDLLPPRYCSSTKSASSCIDHWDPADHCRAFSIYSPPQTGLIAPASKRTPRTVVSRHLVSISSIPCDLKLRVEHRFDQTS